MFMLKGKNTCKATFGGVTGTLTRIPVKNWEPLPDYKRDDIARFVLKTMREAGHQGAEL